MPSEDTRAVYRTIEAFDADKGDVVLGDVFEAVRDDGALLRDGQALDEEAQRMTVRCAADGTPVIPLAAPMHIQLGALRAFDALNEGAEAVAGHLADLAALRARIADPAAQGVTPEMRAETHLYDMTVNAPRDTFLPQRVVDAWTDADIPEKPSVDPVIRKIGADTNIDEDAWTRVIDLPHHRVEQMRAMAREMLRPVLGNAAQLEDLRVLPMGRSEVERSNAVRRWIRESGDVRELPPFTTEAMPGYVTSEPLLAEREGVTLLMFSDFGGSYAYAWQTDPDTAPLLRNEAAEERPFPYNMLP